MTQNDDDFEAQLQKGMRMLEEGTDQVSDFEEYRRSVEAGIADGSLEVDTLVDHLVKCYCARSDGRWESNAPPKNPQELRATIDGLVDRLEEVLLERDPDRVVEIIYDREYPGEPWLRDETVERFRDRADISVEEFAPDFDLSEADTEIEAVEMLRAHHTVPPALEALMRAVEHDEDFISRVRKLAFESFELASDHYADNGPIDANRQLLERSLEETFGVDLKAARNFFVPFGFEGPSVDTLFLDFREAGPPVWVLRTTFAHGLHREADSVAEYIDEELFDEDQYEEGSEAMAALRAARESYRRELEHLGEA